MAISDLAIFSMLRTRLQWHQERQRLLAENVANADTPHFRPHDLAPPDFSPPPPAGGLGRARTAPTHLASLAGDSTRFDPARGGKFEVRPAGNAVNLEDEMMKVAANQMDYQAATTLYTRSLGLIKMAIGQK